MNLNEQVGAATMAEALDIKKTRINELVANGILHPIGSPRMYPFKESLHAYIAYLRGRIDPNKESQMSLEEKKLKADAVYKTSKAATAQLELQELEGNMHRSEDVQAAFEQFAYGVRSMLLALPGRAAINVMGAANAAEAADVIREQVNEILIAITQFYYDPEFFKERVRDRKGWRAVIDEFAGPEGSESKQQGVCADS